MITVDLAAALICFAGACHPALVGEATPPGTYQITLRPVANPKYGGNVLAFHEDDKYIWAVHRTWPGRENLYAKPARVRRHVTKGCINVEPQVYRALRAAVADGAEITIKEGTQ